jgi:hypothetical protein
MTVIPEPDCLGIRTAEDTKKILQSRTPRDYGIRVDKIIPLKDNAVLLESRCDSILKLSDSQILKDLRLKAVPIKKRWPRMLIADVPASVTQDQLTEELSAQNLPDSIPEQFIGKIFKHGRKASGASQSRALTDSVNYVVELHPAARKHFLQTGRVYTTWRSHPIRDFLEVTRCYNCQHYGHLSRNCKSPQACGFCSSTTHESSRCPARDNPQEHKCVNCQRSGAKNTAHHTAANVCPIFKHRLQEAINSTQLMDNKLKVIQVNLRKSRTATEELTAHMLRNNIFIALVQEPYICRHGSNYKIPNLNGLQMAASTSAKFLAAIIYNKDCASPLFVPQLSNSHIAVISAQLETTQLFFASVYLPPSTDIRTEIPALQRAVEATAGNKLVIGGDLNTRSTLWFDEKNDTRSPMLQEFVALNDLDIINK